TLTNRYILCGESEFFCCDLGECGSCAFSRVGYCGGDFYGVVVSIFDVGHAWEAYVAHFLRYSEAPSESPSTFHFRFGDLISLFQRGLKTFPWSEVFHAFPISVE